MIKGSYVLLPLYWGIYPGKFKSTNTFSNIISLNHSGVCHRPLWSNKRRVLRKTCARYLLTCRQGRDSQWDCERAGHGMAAIRFHRTFFRGEELAAFTLWAQMSSTPKHLSVFSFKSAFRAGCVQACHLFFIILLHLLFFHRLWILTLLLCHLDLQSEDGLKGRGTREAALF